MVQLNDLLQTADWKAEKHVPVIEAPLTVKKGEPVLVTLSVGKQIAHPNTTEHHISWIALYFLPKGEKFPYQLGQFEFNAHGASPNGPNTSTVYSEPIVSLRFKTEKAGTLLALSYCNIHGLWQSSQDLAIE